MSNSGEASSVAVDVADTPAPAVDYARKKRRLRWMLLAYAALLGVGAVFMPEEDRVLDFAVGLPLLVMAIIWCHLDAGQREHSMGRFMRLSLVLVFILAFPVYLLQTRGLAGFKTLVLVGLFVAAMAAVEMVTGFATEFLGAMIGVVD